MRKISTDRIEAGSIVAIDVVSPSGNVLLNKGAPVAPAMGRRLRNWGIEHVYIEGDEDSDQYVQAKAKSPIQIKSELYDRFLGTLDNARMKRVFDAVCAHKLQLPGERRL